MCRSFSIPKAVLGILYTLEWTGAKLGQDTDHKAPNFESAITQNRPWSVGMDREARRAGCFRARYDARRW